ncbi:MAG: CTP synthase [Alphaproteobacteria bacterium]|nr:CTP synthase [Alphaproteobacteria bacterium]
MNHNPETKYVFVTGGVVSSLGKGICSAALGALLKLHGYRVRIRKFDPYLNVDAGTMNPYQHGECFVTDDCAETDLDLGHYERFTGVNARKSDCVTAGQIYQEVITREREKGFKGATVQVVPHITGAIKEKLQEDTADTDFVICEIGGTVGDIEGLPFLEGIRQMRNDTGSERTLFIHCTLLPYLETAGELKTKPAQHSVKELLSVGIQPDFMICRTNVALAQPERHKLAQFCNIRDNRLFESQDVATIYAVPEMLHEQGLDTRVLEYFDMYAQDSINLSAWSAIVSSLTMPNRQIVTIGIVGKYVKLPDAYKSLTEALVHAGIHHDVEINMLWIDSEDETADLHQQMDQCQGILVPGGFGVRGTDGMIDAVRYAREKNVPYLGICLGMQVAVIEAMRNIGEVNSAGSAEFHTDSDVLPIIALLSEWAQGENIETRGLNSDFGGTMRLGAADCALKPGSKVAGIYGSLLITERHRHRYEVNPKYCAQFAELGVIFSGHTQHETLPEIPEILERNDHPWFVGVQFHPELKSRPFAPHPLFVSYIGACVQIERLL